MSGGLSLFNHPRKPAAGGGAGVTDHGDLTGLEDDDHPQYLTEAEADALFLTPAEAHALFLTPAEGDAAYDPLGEASAEVGAHEAEANPHPQYLTEAEGDARYALIADGFTDEKAQDAVGVILTNGGGLTWTYNDAGPSISAVVAIASTSVTDFNEAVQDVMGAILVDSNTFDVTYNDGANSLAIDVRMQMSITSDASGIKLSGDAGAPGNSKYYGTDSGGNKGFHNLPSGGAGDLVYAPTPGDVNIASITDVTVASDAVTGIAAGDQIIIEADFIILNNSGATRNIIVTLDVIGGAFDIELTLPALAASATLMHPVSVRGVLNVRATNLSYFMVALDMQLAAGIAAGTDTTAAATHLQAKGWGTTTNDLTGTETVELKMRSAAATATQTCRLLAFTIRKISPTDTAD